MNKEQILDKIKKLLALANSSNEHEAKAASARAQALLTKYNLTMEDAESVDHKYSQEFCSTGRQRMKPQWKYVQSLLREFFFIEIVQTRRRMRVPNEDLFKPIKIEICYLMFGKPHNIEVAKYVRDFLMRAFEDSFKTYREQTGAPAKARGSYYNGLFQGLYEQLMDARTGVEQETGLVVVPDADLNDFVKDSFEKALTTSRNRTEIRDKKAAMAGYEQGKNMNIARGLGGGEDKREIGQTLRLGGSHE